jgi:hypothetical protein
MWEWFKGEWTWLRCVNFFILQWFGVRLARAMCDDKFLYYVLIGPVAPMSGWWSDYVGKPEVFWCSESEELFAPLFAGGE